MKKKENLSYLPFQVQDPRCEERSETVAIKELASSNAEVEKCRQDLERDGIDVIPFLPYVGKLEEEQVPRSSYRLQA